MCVWKGRKKGVEWGKGGGGGGVEYDYPHLVFKAIPIIIVNYNSQCAQFSKSM